MNAESDTNGDSNYEIPCQLLPVTVFDLADGVPPEHLKNLPAGGLVPDELLHESARLEWSRTDRFATDFLFDLHERSLRLLEQTGAGSGLGDLDVWLVILAACQVLAPPTLASAWTFVCNGPANKDDRHAQLKRFLEAMSKKNGDFVADLRQMETRLRDMPEEAARETIVQLTTKLGWEEPKAARGIRALIQVAAEKRTS